MKKLLFFVVGFLISFLSVSAFAGFGGGGAGGSWDDPDNPSTCTPEQVENGEGYYIVDFPDDGSSFFRFRTQHETCVAMGDYYGYSHWFIGDVPEGLEEYIANGGTGFVCADEPGIGVHVLGSPCGCDPCEKLDLIIEKLNKLGGGGSTGGGGGGSDPAVVNAINALSVTVADIKSSLSALTVNNNTEFTDVNTYLVDIDNSVGAVISSNQNIVENINTVGDKLTEYSLKLGDIQLAMGDIDVSLDNTNRLMLDLGVDLEFVKNKLITDNTKDYTPLLNEIILLLRDKPDVEPCVPSDTVVCPDNGYDDSELIAKLVELNDFITADFVPDQTDTTVAVDDLTDIELDRDLISFGSAQCPPDETISTMINGFGFSDGFSHQPLCTFFERLAPYIKAFGGFSAALILGGGLRRG